MSFLHALTVICNDFTDITDIRNLEPTYVYLDKGVRACEEYIWSSQNPLAVEMNEQDRKILQHKNPYVRYLYARVMLYDIQRIKSSYGDRKKRIRDIRMMFLTHDIIRQTHEETDDVIVNLCSTILSNISNEQRKTNSLDSSIVTNIAPIIPYVGAVRPMAITEFATSLETPDRIKLLESLKEMVIHPAVFDYIIKAGGGICRDDDFQTIVSWLLDSDADPFIKKYRSRLWLCMNLDKIPVNSKEMLLSIVKDFPKNDTATMLNVMESLLPEDLEALENVAYYNDKYHSDLIDTLMPPDHQEEYDQNEPVDGFEIQKLIDYIHTQRRFRADDYTNSYFMSNQNIASYSYYKDFILIQPKSNSGVVHYTYVPVIDDAQFSKVVLVRIDRDGNIDIVNDIEKET